MYSAHLALRNDVISHRICMLQLSLFNERVCRSERRRHDYIHIQMTSSECLLNSRITLSWRWRKVRKSERKDIQDSESLPRVICRSSGKFWKTKWKNEGNERVSEPKHSRLISNVFSVPFFLFFPAPSLSCTLSRRAAVWRFFDHGATGNRRDAITDLMMSEIADTSQWRQVVARPNTRRIQYFMFLENGEVKANWIRSQHIREVETQHFDMFLKLTDFRTRKIWFNFNLCFFFEICDFCDSKSSKTLKMTKKTVFLVVLCLIVARPPKQIVHAPLKLS